MKDVCADLLDEYNALAELSEILTPAQWNSKTAFFGWTPWDEIAHLCYFDEMGLLAATDANAFMAETRLLMAEVNKGLEISAIARAKYSGMDGSALLAHWRTRFESLVTQLSTLDSKARLPWYGPTMSARSFATARMMETWAHGQDIFDAMLVRRRPSRRLKHIAHIGVSTYSWTFINRNLPVPEPMPYIELSTPENEIWTWNEPSGDNAVRGNADDFCLVITQRRNVKDTGLQVVGEAATQWMSIAQCFAGPPATPPEPSVRVVSYDTASNIVA